MLEKKELIALLRKEKYSEIDNIFTREYKRILMEFSEKNGIKIDDNPPMSFLMSRIENEFPNLSGYIGLITRFTFCESTPLEESLNLMIDNYNEIKEVFSKKIKK